MPYNGEYAKHFSLSEIIQDDLLKGLLQKISPKNNEQENLLETFAEHIFSAQPEKHNYTSYIAIDGSQIPVEVPNTYPESNFIITKVGFIKGDYDKIKETANLKFPLPPHTLKSYIHKNNHTFVLPNKNIVLDGCFTTQESIRQSLHQALNNIKLFEGGETLSDTLDRLITPRCQQEKEHLPQCPHLECDDANNTMNCGIGEYPCHCSANKTLYNIDLLRIQEVINEDSQNKTANSLIMQVVEKLILVNILHHYEATNLEQLVKTIFIVDGTLAIYNVSSWLSKYIHLEIVRLSQKCQAVYKRGLSVISLEKTGRFVEQFEKIELAYKDGFPKNSFLVLNNNIIYQLLGIEKNNFEEYGTNTYFGRKLFYKTRQNGLLVLNMSYLDQEEKNNDTITEESLQLLDEIGAFLNEQYSLQFKNGINPIAYANENVSLPLNNISNKLIGNIMKENT